MSTQVLPFELAESERAPVPDHPEADGQTESSAGRLGRLIVQLVAGLIPVVILAVGFAVAGDRLANAGIAGVGLPAIIVAIAVVTPLLSQAVSAPMYATLTAVDYRDRGIVSAAILQALPRGAAVAAPIAVAVGAGLAAFRGWGITIALVLSSSLLLNLVMAMLMVVSYATKSARGSIQGWLAYGLAIVCFPAAAWWLPPASAAVVLLVVTWLQARRASSTPPQIGWSRLVGTLPRGLADAVPIWAIPPTLWILDPSSFRAFAVFASIIPAMISYQTFFALVAGRLWAAVDRLQRSLASVGYATAVETEIGPTVREARRASLFVVIINGALTTIAILVWHAFGGSEWRTVPLIVAAAGVAGCATTLSYQYSIISSRAYLSRAALALGAVAVVSVLLHLRSTAAMALYVAVSIVLCALLLCANRNDWLQPEYRLFWARAVRL